MALRQTMVTACCLIHQLRGRIRCVLFLITSIAISIILAVSGVSHGEPISNQPKIKSPALSVQSIIPAHGEPGMTVTLNGTGFTGVTKAVLGSYELPVIITQGRVLTFVLPDLRPGVYSLYLEREDGATSKPYNFVLQPLRPIISKLYPNTISICAAGWQRGVVLSGANFDKGVRVLFDGATIDTHVISATAISFTAPDVSEGMHVVQVKNPGGAVSGTLALFLDSRPEILSVTVGGDHVVYYNLILTGRNFLESSILVVNGKRVFTGQPGIGEADELIYQDCNRLLYRRHPYDPEPKEITLQVLNPNGEESNTFSISAP